MTLARLLATVLTLCCLPASSQDQQSQSSFPPTGRITEQSTRGQGPTLNREVLFYLNSAAAATPSEPWRIIPSRPEDVPQRQNALDPRRLDQYPFNQIKGGDTNLRHLRLDTLNEDTTCCAIRSYVVARDSKDSDSTHPAGYSTCQPAARYRLKTTEIRSESAER